MPLHRDPLNHAATGSGNGLSEPTHEGNLCDRRCERLRRRRAESRATSIYSRQ